MPDWVGDAVAEITERAERELEALVAVSSPSGDRRAAEEAIAVATALLPSGVEVERVACSSPDHAPDLLATLTGTGSRRLLLLGHVDTVIAHEHHRPIQRADDRLVGSGVIDMKGGVVLALGVLRALAHVPEAYAEVALLLVCDEEWRTAAWAHGERFTGYDACLCFEAGQRTDAGGEGVVVRRKAAGTLRVRAQGVAAHSGSSPDRGRNALLALTRVAQTMAAHHAPAGPERLTVVPTILRSGEALNVVPATGELFCDLRAERLEAFDAVLASVPEDMAGVTLEADMIRRWPGMDARSVTAPLLQRAGRRLGRRIVAAERGGASDASHVAQAVPLTIDGLGPHGGGAHTPGEYLLVESLRPRVEVALAVAAEAVAGS